MSDSEIPSIEELGKLKLKELKERCKEAELAVTGSKKELAERLHAHLLKKVEDSLLSDELLEDNAGEPEEPEESAKAQESPSKESAPPAAPPATPPAAPPAAAKPKEKPQEQEKVESVEAKKPKVADEEKPAATTKKALTDEERLRLRAQRFSSGSSATTDAEMEERKRKRAERFGTRLVPAKPGSVQGAATAVAASAGDVDAMRKRAERFGEVTSPALKSAGVVGGSDKLKARAQRFGLPPTNEEKLKQRAERFNLQGKA